MMNPIDAASVLAECFICGSGNVLEIAADDATGLQFVDRSVKLTSGDSKVVACRECGTTFQVAG